MKVAQALYEEWNGVGGWSSLTDYDRNRWGFMAAAAFGALRDPSEEMIEAGSDARRPGNSRWGNSIGTWKAMLDAGYNEGSSS